MVQIGVVRFSNATLIKSQPLVAVFVGGMSGIGEHTIHALAATHVDRGKGLHLYIVGRNADAGGKIILDCARVCPSGHFFFMRADDLSLLKDVDRVCAEIIQGEKDENGNGARVDLLIMSQAFSIPLSHEDIHDLPVFHYALLFASGSVFLWSEGHRFSSGYFLAK